MPAWFIDPANSSGVASDGNACTTSGTPCLTWHEINDHRWGCLGNPKACPRIRQSTTITWISGVTNDSDPVIHLPSVENQALEILTCTPTLVKNYIGGLSIVAKVRGGPGQLLNATFDASAALDLLAINVTHPSHAWTYKSLGANVFALTQPLVALSPPGVIAQAEVNTWASGDTVSLNTVPQVDFVDLEPQLTATSGAANNAIYLQGCNLFDPGSGDYFNTNALVRMSDVSATSTKFVIVNGGPGSAAAGCSNCDLRGGSQTSGVRHSNWLMAGGTTGGVFSSGGPGYQLDGDVISAGGLYNQIFLVAGAVYFDTGSQAAIQGYVLVGNFNGYGGPSLWGTGFAGTLQVTGNGHIQYPSGAGAAATTFPLTGGLRVDFQTLTCLGVPSVALPTLTCNITLSPANLDTNLGATLGCLYVPGGGSVCNL